MITYATRTSPPSSQQIRRSRIPPVVHVACPWPIIFKYRLTCPTACSYLYLFLYPLVDMARLPFGGLFNPKFCHRWLEVMSMSSRLSNRIAVELLPYLSAGWASAWEMIEVVTHLMVHCCRLFRVLGLRRGPAVIGSVHDSNPNLGLSPSCVTAASYNPELLFSVQSCWAQLLQLHLRVRSALTETQRTARYWIISFEFDTDEWVDSEGYLS
jgi:hypothetical protein